MEADRGFERYFVVLSRWATPEQLDRILRWAEPHELEALFDAIGSPDDAERMIIAVKERSADWIWARTLKEKLSRSATVFLIIAAVVGILRPFTLWFIARFFP